jgi:selenocysteine-specific elongation factor
MDIIVGTAGHIDHGKTQLVKALTGTDADRLPEEKERGITIDLGFAELAVGDTHFGFVDVPGHERFVKNMLAGASGIDLVALVIAADEGIMPQTREHFDICRLLKIGNGVVAITKSDLVDEEMLGLVRSEVEEFVDGTFLENAPIVAVSAKTGNGIEELKQVLVTAASALSVRKNDVVARLPIDRSFTIKGFGAVVTGTLASGSIAEGDELDLLPTGKTVRVRGVQSHDKKVERSVAGRRTALNLAGIDHSQVSRGMMLAEHGVLHPSQMFDAAVEVLADAARLLRTRQRVRLHIGTAEVLARIVVIGEEPEIKPGENGFVQLRLESPIVAVLGERFILRSYSPQITIAGGAILRPTDEKVRKRNFKHHGEFLSRLLSAIENPGRTLSLLIENSGDKGISKADVRAVTGWQSEVLKDAIDRVRNADAVIESDDILITANSIAKLKDIAVGEIKSFCDREPLARGLALEALREKAFKHTRSEIERAVLSGLVRDGQVIVDKEVVRLAGMSTEMSEAETSAFEHLRSTYQRLEVPKLEEALSETAQRAALPTQQVRKLLQKLLDSGEVVRVSSEFYFSQTVIDDVISKLKAFAARSADRTIDVPAFKELAGVSRKYAIPLLEYFDQQKITARRGDKRLII